ncbi:MAG: hypothetical protein K0R38_997 [Polyangiaceae bacterium]|jgi:AraC-like DNA-binding protein|nr:hypothetical protein [Polyangiaceae bacterium]
MIHVAYAPKAPLDRFVDSFWAAGEYVAEAPRERVLPNGMHTLVIVLGERPLLNYYPSEDASAPVAVPGAVLCGTRQTPLVIGTSFGATVGVHFKPGGARPFFDVRADELTEQAVPLEALWGADARLLRERLHGAPTPRERVRILESFLLTRVRPSRDLAPALRLALQAFEDPWLESVAEVNRRTGLSAKQLLARFRDEVGLSPKAFWRVRRFRAALAALDSGARGAALASHLGYADQPHFLREFKAMAGSPPGEFLATRVTGTDHVSVYR